MHDCPATVSMVLLLSNPIHSQPESDQPQLLLYHTFIQSHRNMQAQKYAQQEKVIRDKTLTFQHLLMTRFIVN